MSTPRWSLLLGLIFLVLLPGSLSATGLRMDIQDYALELRELSLLALKAKEEQQPEMLRERLAEMPLRVTVTYPISNDETGRQKVHLGWLKYFFRNNLPEHHSWEEASEGQLLFEEIALIETLRQLLEMEISNTEEKGGFELNDKDFQKRIELILKNGNYSFRDEKSKEEEEQEFEPPPEPPGWLRSLQKAGKAIEYILVILVIIVALFLLYRFRYFFNFSRKSTEPEIVPGQGLLQADDPTDFEALYKLGETARDEKQLRESIRYLYLSFIVRLHDEKVIRYQASLTNWEYYRLLLEKEFPQAPLHTVTLIFDETHYGEREVDEALANSFQKELNTCLAHLNPRKK